MKTEIKIVDGEGAIEFINNRKCDMCNGNAVKVARLCGLIEVCRGCLYESMVNLEMSTKRDFESKQRATKLRKYNNLTSKSQILEST
jgi:hypothetical protein